MIIIHVTNEVFIIFLDRGNRLRYQYIINMYILQNVGFEIHVSQFQYHQTLEIL